MKKAVCLFLFIAGMFSFLSGICCVFHWWIDLLLFCFSSWLWLPQILLWIGDWQKHAETNSRLLNFAIAESMVYAFMLMLMPVLVLVFNFNLILYILFQIFVLAFTIIVWLLVILEKIIKLAASRLSKRDKQTLAQKSPE